MQSKDEKTTSKKSYIVYLLISLILNFANIFCVEFLLKLSKFYTILWLVGCGALIICAFIFFAIKLKPWLKLVLVTTIIVSLILWGYYVVLLLGWQEFFSSPEALQQAVASTGGWGMSVYVLIQFLQVTFIPLPAMVTTLAGTALFGPFLATILSLIGIMLGSVFAFWLGDRFGEKICIWIAGKETTEKYSKLLYEKGKYLFFLMMLFPLFPDDILCLVAGMTAMSFRYFMVTIILTRPIGIIMTCYLGSGQIIPYSGWGLIVWAVIVLIIATLFILAYKFQPQIEETLGKWAQKMSHKKNKLKLQTDDKRADNSSGVLLLPPPQEGDETISNETDNKKVV